MSVTIKSQQEIDLLRIAAQVVKDTHDLLSTHLTPGITTLELDKIAEDYIRSRDCIPTFKGYDGFPGSICVSINDCVIHGIPSKDVIVKDGDLVSIDIGTQYKGYCGDAARSYIVGTEKPSRKQLLEVTKLSLDNAINILKDGTYLSEIGKAVQDTVKPYQYGIVREYTGHGIGAEMHEDPQIPNYQTPDIRDIRLRKGMVICIEPMIMEKQDKVKMIPGKGIYSCKKYDTCHQEDQILITENGCEVLSR